MPMEIPKDDQVLQEQLGYLKLPFFRDNYDSFAKKAAQKQWEHVHYLSELTIAEVNLRRDSATQRRIKQAHFPQIKTLDGFKWAWPKKINRLQVQNVFRLNFIADKSNVVFIGGVGLGNYVKHSFM
jgi:DNA replication protein DnaC